MKKRTTLAKQLTVKIVIIAALIFIVAMFFAITVAKNTASKLSKDVMKKETTTAQNEIEDWVSGKTGYLDGLLDAVKNLDTPSDEVLFGLLSGAVAQEGLGASDVYMAGAEHWFCDGTGWIPGEDFDATTRGWYISGLANEKMHIGEVYLDAITGTYMVGVSAKVSDKTVLSADISIDEVARETNSITILDSGYAMLIEKNTGFVIAHPDDKIAGTTIAENGDVFLSDIYANTDNMDTLFPITYDGQKYFVIMEEIKGTDWILIGCAPYSCVMGQLSNLQVMITFMVVIALLILIMVSVLLIRQATKPIHELTESIEVITSGDFTKEVRTSGNNEITTTEEALKKFIARMRDVIRDVSDVSNKLADDADNSKKASQNIYDSVGKQTCSVKQLNEAVDEVGRSIEDLATNATSLAMVVSEVNEDGTKASADMQNAYELAEEGRRDIQKVADKMEEILSAITNLKQTVSEVGKSTKEINQITDVIGDISSQTNLLALNASIEAARAGEAGKGFAVVATEIGNLANMSASAVTRIADMINQMDLDMKQCIEQTDITEKDIDESGNYVKKTYETFGQIYDKIEVTTGLIEKMTKKIQTVDEVAANMAATTEEQSAKTQEMMDTAQDLYQHSVTIENNSADIRTLSEEVSGFADKVKERLDVFEI